MNKEIEEYKLEKRVKQSDIDNEYPDEYKYDYGITTDQWIACLNHERSSRLEDRILLKKIYRSDNHLINTAFTESFKGLKEGSIMFQLLFLAQSFKNILNLEVLDKLEMNEYWKILFWGRKVYETYELKLKPELVIALEEVFPELLFEEGNRLTDYKINEVMANINYNKQEEFFTFNKIIRPSLKPHFINGVPCFESDLIVAKNAVIRAGYVCELDEFHQTFAANQHIRGYIETIHLIPLEYQPYFDVSLDVEENVVCLCANCVKQLKYGYSNEILIKQLYNQRKKVLEKVGIEISFERLLEMYDTESKPEAIKEAYNSVNDYDFNLMS